ncbi:MAG: diguanylate cyclase [Glaciecola sp.]
MMVKKSTPPAKMSTNKPSTNEYLQISLLLSLLTIVTNLFLSFNVIGSPILSVGASFVYLGMLMLPRLYVLPIILSCSVTLIATGPTIFLSVIFMLECYIIFQLRQRKVVMILAAVIYWLLIGVPLLWIGFHFSFADLPGTSIILSLQQAFIGLINVALATTIFACLPHKHIFAHIPRQSRLSTNIFNICASTLVLPLLVIAFMFILRGLSLQEEAIKKEQAHRAQLIALYTNNFILKHKTVITQLAHTISNGNTPQGYGNVLVNTQKEHSNFFNITTSDNNGNLLFFAPAKYNDYYKKHPDKLANIADRLYFQKAKTKRQVIVSNGIISQGVQQLPMIAFAAPIIKASNFSGIVFGTINLSSASGFEQSITDIIGNNNVVITDSNKQILYSNMPNFMGLLEAFTPNYFNSVVLANTPMFKVNNDTYIYGKYQNDDNWHIYVFKNSQATANIIRNQFVVVAIGLLLVLAVFLFFVDRLSRRITAPLVSLLNDEDEVSPADIDNLDTSQEISEMAKKLKRSSYLVRNFENRLKLQVSEKTEQLEQLNLQLAAQAREDGLTALYNRSGFNELAINAIKTSYRLQQNFSLVLLDIDNFKNINDTYGHPLGDKCLVAFANLMQGFCKRDTDIIGRYGGEEFIIFMSGTDVASQHNIIQDIHQQTRFISVRDDVTGKSVNFTVSIGVCTVIGSINLSLRELTILADEELYKCKRNGRDKISVNTLTDM